MTRKGAAGDHKSHETLLRRSSSQDRQSSPSWDVQVRCSSPVQREPLLRQAIRQDSRARRVSRAKEGRRQATKADETIQRLLEEDVHERPAATIADRSRFLQSMTGKSLSVSTLKRLLKRMSFSQKNGLWGRWNGMSGEERPGR